MQCPVCYQALPTQSGFCQHCGFQLDDASSAFGAVPALDPEITDMAGVLGASGQRRVRAAVKRAQRTFPQLKFSAVVARLPDDSPLRAITFWIFNLGRLSTPLEAGGACRLVLFLVDTAEQRASCMVGYGLEPFFPEQNLARVAQAAVPAMQKEDYAKAVIAMIARAVEELTTVASALPQEAMDRAKAASKGHEQTEDAFVY